MSIHPADLVIHAVEGGDTTFLEPLVALYVELFPQYAYYVPLMRLRAERAPDADPRWIEHQWVITVNGDPAGMMIFKYLRASRVGLLLDIGILPRNRRLHIKGMSRLAHYLYLRALDRVYADAASLGHDRPLGLLAEVPHAALVHRYLSYGFIELPVAYFEPPGTPELDALNPEGSGAAQTFHRMHLVFLPGALPHADAMAPSSIAQLVTALLTEHYGLPYNHWTLQKALASLP